MSDAVTVSLITGGCLVLSTAIPSILSARTHKLAKQNSRQLTKIDKQTNGELNKKIAAAVNEVLVDHPQLTQQAVVAEAMRDLLTERIIGVEWKGPKHADRG